MTPEGLCTKCSATQYCKEHAPVYQGIDLGKGESWTARIGSGNQVVGEASPLHAQERSAEEELSHLRSALAEAKGEIASLQAMRDTLAKHAQGLIGYVVDNGSLHDDDCPGDDTCECSEKPKNDAANRICNLAEAADPALAALREQTDQDKALGAHVRHGGRGDLEPAARPELSHDGSGE